jgi:RNA polymerase sigma-70 factor (ECF subfamily)
MSSNDPEQTSATLLRRLGESVNEDDQAEFAKQYSPMIVRMALTLGLQDADALDLAQDLIIELFRILNENRFEYDRKKGRFRGYIRTCVRNAVRDARKSRQQRIQGSGDSEVLAALQNLEQETHIELADKICRLDLFQQAANKVRFEVGEEKYRVFEAVKLLGIDPVKVAATENLTRGNVDVIVFRFTRRLNAELRELADEELRENEELDEPDQDSHDING